jgi:hypothetical protein
LWDAITKKRRVMIYVGELQEAHKRWIAASDHQLESTLVEFLSGHGVATPEVSTQFVPFHFVGDSSKDRRLFKEDIEGARKIFKSMKKAENRSAILIGSQRTNYLVEAMMADLIGCEPFVAADTMPPVYLRHHDRGHMAPSCFGGKGKPPGFKKGATPPGVYYRGESEWIPCLCEDKKEEAGVVVITRDPGIEKTVIAIFGLTGWGTQVIGRALLKEDFWQPMVPVKAKGKEVAMFVCKFTFHDAEESTRAPETDRFTLIPLDGEVLKQHLR